MTEDWGSVGETNEPSSLARDVTVILFFGVLILLCLIEVGKWCLYLSGVNL